MEQDHLPFPVHGTRHDGGDDRGAGHGDAARLLYFANLIAQTSGVSVFGLSRQTPYGAISASVHGPLAFKRVTTKPPAEDVPLPEPGISRLVWLPEGFVITPRTPTAPDGFGMPPTPGTPATPSLPATPYGPGTPGGPLRQVILNRFAENQYPDAVYRSAGGAAGGVSYAANLFFMDWENQPGEMRIGMLQDPEDDDSFLPQFSSRYVTNYREPDAGKWFCHRPQNSLVESDAEKLIRTETNLMREQVGRKPLSPPLRGTAGELSQNIAYQIRWSGEYDHDRPEFRDGHRTFLQRTEERTGFAGTVGENLNLEFPAALDEYTVRRFMGSWRLSPGHYGSIVADWHEEGNAHGWIDPAFTDAGDATFPPGTEGAIGVQIFYSARDWVSVGPGLHGARPPVTVAGPQAMYRPIYLQRSTASGNGYWPFVMYRGRTVFVTSEAVDVNEMEVLSGTTVVEKGTETKLRVAALLRPALNAGQVFLVIYEGAVHDFLVTKLEIARHPLPMADADQISVPVWSASGKKMAFGVTTLSPAPKGRIRNLASEPEFTTFVGQQLHFWEFNGTSIADKGVDRLQIDATDFSPTHQKSTCLGTVRLLPAYVGEVLVYVYVEVNSSVYFSPTKFEKRVYGALVFHGGERIVYADQSGSDETPGERKPAKGFVRHLLPFDVNDPASVAYVQYDHPEQPEDLGISARLIIRGTQVKYSPCAYDSGFPGPHFRQNWTFGGVLEYTLDSFRGNPYWDPFGSPGMSFFGGIKDKYTPSVVFDGVVVGDSSKCAPGTLDIGPPGTYQGPVATSPKDTNYVLLGPVLLRDGVPVYERLYEDSPGTQQLFDRVEEFKHCKYKGEWLYAGRIENTLGGTGEFNSGYSPGLRRRSAWFGDDQYYFHSSLDLKAITKLPALSQNILPIGVL